MRHLPNLRPENTYLGADYNKKSNEWCSKYLPEIEFNHNGLKASLPYNSNVIDVIYGISVLPI